MKSILRYEHGKLLIGQEGFKKEHWNEFVKLNLLHDGKYFDVLHNGIKFKQFVGVIQIDGLLVKINPKADKGDEDGKWSKVLLQMLLSCGRIKAQTIGSASVNRNNLNLLDVYFELYLFEIEKLIRQGLVKRYHTETSNVKALKGKLEFAGNLRFNTVHKERFYTTHQVYDTNHLLHQTLSYALGIVDQFTSGSRLNSICKRVRLDFPDVDKGIITSSQLNKVVLNRKTAPYTYAFELARLIILNYSPDINSGREKMISLLFDMNQLWEEYILLKLKRFTNQYYPYLEVKGQTSKSFWGNNSLKPDILVTNKLTQEKIIIDTKWKRPEKSSASVQDLRQMYAYSRFWNAEKVLLLYPGESRDNLFLSFENIIFDKKEHKCKMGFVSVLDDQNNLNPNIGFDILKITEIIN